MTRDNSFSLLDRLKQASTQKACLMLACLMHLGWRRWIPDVATSKMKMFVKMRRYCVPLAGSIYSYYV